MSDKITREMLTTPMTDFTAQRLNQPMTQEERERIETIVRAVAETHADAPGDTGLVSGVSSE